MIRFVAPVNAYEVVDGVLTKIGEGVTHYQVPWVDGIVGGRPPQGTEGPTGLLAELVDAGLPSTIMTSLRSNDDGPCLDIAILLDDESAWEATIASVVDDHIIEAPVRLAAWAAAAVADEGGS